MQEIERLQHRSNELQQVGERYKERLAPLIRERDTFAIEYQKQMLLAEISPNSLQIKEELEKLNKQSRPKTTDDRLLYASSERTLEKISEPQFMEILERVRPVQAEKLKVLRELEKELERTKTHTRSR